MKRPRKKQRAPWQKTLTGIMTLCAFGVGVTLAIAVAEDHQQKMKESTPIQSPDPIPQDDFSLISLEETIPDNDVPPSDKPKTEPDSPVTQTQAVTETTNGETKEAVPSETNPLAVSEDLKSSPSSPSNSETPSPSDGEPVPSTVIITSSWGVFPVGGESFATEEEKKSFNELADISVFAFPLLLTDRMEKIMTHSPCFAPVNQMAYFPSLPTAGLRISECPNVDALTSMAWLDLSEGAQVILFPANPRQGFITEMTDAWTNVFGNVDKRNLEDYPIVDLNGRKVRSLLLIGPNDPITPPEGMKTIKAPTDRVWLINRVFPEGSADGKGNSHYPAACRTLYEFEVLSLDSFLKETRGETIPSETSFLPASMTESFGDLFPATSPEKLSALDLSGMTSSNPSLTSGENALSTNRALQKNPVVKENPEKTVSTEKMNPASPTDPAEPTAQSLSTRERGEGVVYEYRRVPGNLRPVLVRRVSNIVEKSVITTDETTDQTIDQPAKENPEKNVGDNPSLKTNEEMTAETSSQVPETSKKEGIAEKTEEAMSLFRDDVDNAFRQSRDWGDRLVRSGHQMDRRIRQDFHSWARDLSISMGGENWKRHSLRQTLGMDGREFFTLLAENLAKNPPMESDHAMTEMMARYGIVPGSFDWDSLPSQTRHLIRFALPFAHLKISEAGLTGKNCREFGNHWILPEFPTPDSTDYLGRAVAAEKFIGGDLPKEILYPFTERDASGEVLFGANHYQIHFEKGATPPTNLLWSITLYDRMGRLVPNREYRYGVRSNQPLEWNGDGSLDITISAEKPTEKISNWIPAPKGEFILMMRIYLPEESVTNGEWKIPPVTKTASVSDKEMKKEAKEVKREEWKQAEEEENDLRIMKKEREKGTR